MQVADRLRRIQVERSTDRPTSPSEGENVKPKKWDSIMSVALQAAPGVALDPTTFVELRQKVFAATETCLWLDTVKQFSHDALLHCARVHPFPTMSYVAHCRRFAQTI